MKFKISKVMALFLAIIATTVAIPIKTQAADVTKQIVSIGYPRAADNTKPGYDTWGHGELKYVNGMVHKASKFTNMQFVEAGNDSICYCIEPGKPVNDGGTYTQRDESYFDKLSGNSLLDTRQIKEALGRIFQYGYQGTISYNWVSQNAQDADNMANAMATQFLIWEVIVGERDKYFNYVAPPSGYNKILDGMSSKHPLRSKVMTHYNRIASSLQNHVGSPSFMEESVSKAQTVELKWNGKEYTASLTDTNNVLNKFKFTPNNSNVKVTVRGNKLILTSSVVVKNVQLSAIKNGTHVRSGIVVWEAPSVDQTVATYAAEVTDPIIVYIKLQSEQLGNAKIIKTSSDGVVSGIEFTLSGENLTAPIKGVTNSVGTLTFSGLKAGTYTITETVPPKYESQKPQTITVRAGQTATVIFANKLKTHDLEIIKVNEKDEAVSGVVFIIEKSLDGKSWTELMQKETDENGKASFAGLSPDVYYKVTEIKTKDGYSLLSEPVFEGQISTADKPVITIKAINNPEFELPPTGGNSFLYIPIVLGLSMGAIVTIYYLIKKERGKKI